jgi:hypothetical protein
VDTPIQHVTWAPHHGMAQRHWEVLRRYAGSRRVYLLLRGAPPAAIPWIERAFPPRPYELGFLDVDPASGLLLAEWEAHRVRVFAHGHYVLTPVNAELAHGAASGGAAVDVAIDPAGAAPGRGPPLNPFLAVNPRQAPLPVVFRERWARAGVVVDRRSQRPFTGAYDLLAVVGEGDGFHQPQSVGTAANAAAPLGWRRSSASGGATRFLAVVRHDLNRLIEGERVLDGTRGQPPGRGPSTAAASGTSPLENLLVFGPDGAVGLLRVPCGGWSRLQVRTVVAVAGRPQR